MIIFNTKKQLFYQKVRIDKVRRTIWGCISCVLGNSEIKKVVGQSERLESLYKLIIGANSSHYFEENSDTIVAEPEVGYN